MLWSVNNDHLLLYIRVQEYQTRKSDKSTVFDGLLTRSAEDKIIQFFQQHSVMLFAISRITWGLHPNMMTPAILHSLQQAMSDQTTFISLIQP